MQSKSSITFNLKCTNSLYSSRLLARTGVSRLCFAVVLGVFGSGGGGDDGGEPSRCTAADSAVHHEQISLCGDI